MTFHLEIADRLRTVEVLRSSDRATGARDSPALSDSRISGVEESPAMEPHAYKVIVDGHPRLVEAVRVAEDLWSLIVRDEAGSEARSVEAVVLTQAAGARPGRRGNGTLDVHIDGYRIPVHLRNHRERRSSGPGVADGRGPQRLTAPMPGKVVRVLVKPGDEVRARQGLVVVEAMKMENELRASREGRVGAVLVSEGQSVEAGTALVVVE